MILAKRPNWGFASLFRRLGRRILVDSGILLQHLLVSYLNMVLGTFVGAPDPTFDANRCVGLGMVPSRKQYQ